MPQLNAQSQGPSTIGSAGPPGIKPSRQYSAPLSDDSIRHQAFRQGTIEPVAATLLRELLGPTIAVATFARCLRADGHAFSFEFFGLGLIVFFVCDRILSPPESIRDANGRHRFRPSPARLLLEWCCIAALLGLLVTALGFGRTISRHVLLSWYLITPPVLLLSNYGVVRLARWWTARHTGSIRHIVIGATEVGLEFAKRVERDACAGQFVGFFDFRARERLPALASKQWVGSCATVTEFVQRNAIDAIYIALPISTAPRITSLLEGLRDTTASIYFVPSLLTFDLVQPRYLEIQGIPVLAVCETPFRGMSALRKRAFDIVLAVLVLLPGAPIMLAIALAVKLSSTGPVLFRQRRYGLHGEEIYVYKFRSMTVCEDGTVIHQATKDDRRVTRLGRFLRRTSFDELPQIFNVLAGHMSFVGPRPHAVAHNELYRKVISGYMLRHKIRPGITGWAQVNGLRGETDTLAKMRARIQYDIDYLKNWSLWLDLKILARTVMVLLHDNQAY